MKKVLFATLTILLFITACGLKRSNPLDPVASPHIEIPGKVLGIEVTVSPISASPRYIDIEWQAMSNVSGYYIYRALSYDSSYERIKTIEDNTIGKYRDLKNIISGGMYFYRLSAFTDNPEGRLEGSLSSSIGKIVN
jgi:hypothetical protein